VSDGSSRRRAARVAQKAAAAAAWREMAGIPEPPTASEPSDTHERPTTARKVLAAAGDGASVSQVAALTWMAGAADAVAAGRSAPRVPDVPQPIYWNRARFTSELAEGWFEGDNFVLFRYMASRPMVVDFKDMKPAALVEVTSWMLGTLPGIASTLRSAGCRFVLTPPGRNVGPARGSAEALCATLASAFPWLEHMPGALERTDVVSSRYHDGRAPGLERHLATIRVTIPRPPPTSGPSAALLFDDVFRDGATSEACRRHLMQSLGVDRVFGLFITRTSAQWPPSKLVKLVAGEQ
jgi:hypothetical protein